MDRRTWMRIGAVGATGLACAAAWSECAEKRVAVVEPGSIVRGAWQRPLALRRLVERLELRTILTLTAINRDDPKYVEQARVVQSTGLEWLLIPMRGSTSTLGQLAQAADLLAESSRRPIFFHCVAGHHRSNLVHAAYLIRHRGLGANAAWARLAALPWTNPGAPSDRRDVELIRAFAAVQATIDPSRLELGRG